MFFNENKSVADNLGEVPPVLAQLLVDVNSKVATAAIASLSLRVTLRACSANPMCLLFSLTCFWELETVSPRSLLGVVSKSSLMEK
jgi:hypothetical protein